jgi:hypothetical protein
MASKTREQEAQDRRDYLDKTNALSAIIKPLNTAEYEADFSFKDIATWLAKIAGEWGGLNLNPDYQRGHVWKPEQQRRFIESVLRGTVSSSGFVLQFNCPNWENDNYAGDMPAGFECIDGLQRYTAVQAFVAGEIKPFGLSVEELQGSTYAIHRYSFKIAVHCFQNRVDLLNHYLAHNDGGTPHSREELDRVTKLRDDAVAAMAA